MSKFFVNLAKGDSARIMISVITDGKEIEGDEWKWFDVLNHAPHFFKSYVTDKL